MIDFGFHLKFFLVTSEMILNSTPNILQSHQKWFWIPLKLIHWNYTQSCQKWSGIPSTRNSQNLGHGHRTQITEKVSKVLLWCIFFMWGPRKHQTLDKKSVEHKRTHPCRTGCIFSTFAVQTRPSTNLPAFIGGVMGRNPLEGEPKNNPLMSHWLPTGCSVLHSPTLQQILTSETIDVFSAPQWTNFRHPHLSSNKREKIQSTKPQQCPITSQQRCVLRTLSATAT